MTYHFLLLISYFYINIIISSHSNSICSSSAADDCVVPNILHGIDIDRLSRFGSYLDDSISNNEIAGASFAVYRNNSLIHSSYHGYQDINSSKKISSDTIFRIFSMTKPVISVGLMMLWEQNKFQLSDSLSKYIPSFLQENMKIYDYENNENINISNISLDNIATKPIENDIKIWNILTHTAGISYGFDASGTVNPVDKLYQPLVYKLFDSNNSINLEEFVNELASMPLVYEPGTQWHYSYAADICGRLIEVISGESLDVYLYNNIFKPLNMKDTTFKFKNINRNNVAKVYQQTENETLIEYDGFWVNSQYEPGHKCFSGGAGLLSTLSDYLSFTKMLLNGGINKENNIRLLSPETIKFMTINHLPNNCDIQTFIFPNSTIKYIFRSGLGFGLGFSVILNRRVSDGLGIMASEGAYAFGGALDTLFFIDPNKDLCVVFMVQLVPKVQISYHQLALQRFVYSSIVD